MPDLILRCAECRNDFVWTAPPGGESPRPTLCPMCQRLAPGPGRSRGIVKWFSHGKGYGFLTSTDGADLFVHKSGLRPGQSLLRAGQLVEFSLTTTPRGMQAEDVVALELSDQPADTA